MRSAVCRCPWSPNGASLDAQEFFRNKGDASGFKLMLRVSELDPMTPDGLFLLAAFTWRRLFGE